MDRTLPIILCVALTVLALQSAPGGAHIASDPWNDMLPPDYEGVRPLIREVDPASTWNARSKTTPAGNAASPLLLSASDLFGDDAGCRTGSAGMGWAETGTPGAPCDHEVHDWGIRYAVLDCPNGCFADAWHTEFLAVFIISCTPGARTIFSFDALEGIDLGTGACEVFGFGEFPMYWTSWDGQGWVRDMRFSYTDTLEGALARLVV